MQGQGLFRHQDPILSITGHYPQPTSDLIVCVAVLTFCKGTVGIFYSTSQQGRATSKDILSWTTFINVHTTIILVFICFVIFITPFIILIFNDTSTFVNQVRGYKEFFSVNEVLFISSHLMHLNFPQHIALDFRVQFIMFLMFGKIGFLLINKIDKKLTKIVLKISCSHSPKQSYSHITHCFFNNIFHTNV